MKFTPKYFTVPIHVEPGMEQTIKAIASGC